MASIVKNLKLLKVVDKGVKTKEHLIIAVVQKCNLQDYMVYDNSYNSDGTLSNEHMHLFRFPNQNVSEKDFVFLYTDEGTNHERPNKGGGKNYYYFMNLNNETIWNKGKDVAHLLLISEEQDLTV